MNTSTQLQLCIIAFILLAIILLNFVDKDRIPLMIWFFAIVLPKLPLSKILTKNKNNQQK
jgi:hypothetical protein